MTKEQEEAIERLDRLTVYEEIKGNIGIPVMIKDLKTVLNLLKEKDTEIEDWKTDYNHRCQLAIDRKVELEKKDKTIELNSKDYKVEG